MIWLMAMVPYPARAQGEDDSVSNIAFLDKRPIQSRDPSGPELPLKVSIVNLSPESQVVTLYLAAADAVDEPSQLGQPAQLTPGSVHTFEIAVPASKYTGSLIATSQSGGFATRALTVSITSDAPDAGLAEVDKPLPSKLAMARDKLIPTPITPVIDQVARVLALLGVSPMNLPDLASAGFQWGVLRATDETSGVLDGVALAGPSTLARVTVGEGRLVDVKGASRAGAYTGTAKFGSGDDEQALEISLNARDLFLWPLLALLGGLWAASKLDDFLTKRRPKALLRLHIRRVEEAAVREQNALREWLNGDPLRPWPASKRQPVVIYAEGSGDSIVQRAIDKALEQFDRIESPDERNKLYGVPLGTEVVALDGYVERLPKIKRLAEVVSKKHGELVELLGVWGVADQVSRMPIVVRVAHTWSNADVVTDSDQYDALIEEMEASAALLAKLVQVVSLAVPIAERAAKDDDKAKATELRSKTLSATLNTAEALTKLETDWATLSDAIGYGRRLLRRADLDEGVYREGTADDTLERLRAHLGLSNYIRPSEDLALELKDQERFFNRLALVLVVLTGLVVYFGNATFGSAKDYIEMFLWATTAATVVSLARRLPVAEAIAKVAAR